MGMNPQLATSAGRGHELPARERRTRGLGIAHGHQLLFSAGLRLLAARSRDEGMALGDPPLHDGSRRQGIEREHHPTIGAHVEAELRGLPGRLIELQPCLLPGDEEEGFLLVWKVRLSRVVPAHATPCTTSGSASAIFSRLTMSGS